MRVACMVGALLMAGCSFNVIGTNTGDPGAPAATPSPTQSVPDAPDLATAPPATTPPSIPPTTTPDMAAQHIGTACTTDAQCDPGLFCAKSFGIGPARIDIPGGYCTLDCTQAACPANSICSTFTFGKYCLSSCPPDPCRQGYSCCDADGAKGCATDSMCAATGKGGK